MTRQAPRIVHVLPWQLCVGGAQRFIADLCAWSSPWAELHLVHLSRGSDQSWTPLLTGVHCHAVDTPDQARQIIEKLDPDLIHHHYPQTEWGLHGLFDKFNVMGTPHGWVGNINPPDWTVPICGEKVQIRHGINLDHYKPGRRPKPDGRFHVGIVGRLREDKVPMHFIHALRAWLPKQRGRIVVHFIGRGLNDRAGRRVQQAAAAIRGVRLHGDIPPDQMPHIYNQLDAVLIPSARDSVNWAALEAMACEIPVIVRNVEGLPETVGSAGIVCPDDAALLSAVERLQRNQMEQRQLARRGRERVQLLYDQQRMLNQYGAVYWKFTKGLVRPPKNGVDVSVALPVADGIKPEWLYKAVESIRAQTVAWELLLVSDGVTDPHLKKEIDAIEQRSGVRVFRLEKNQGISVALNVALMHAEADLVARADGDDIMPAGRLAAQVDFMRKHPDITLLSGDMARITSDGGLAPMPRRVLRNNQPLWEYWEGNWPVAHPTVMYRRYPVMAVGGYSADVICGQDLDLWCRLQAAGYRFAKLDVVWNHYRIHDNQQTAKRAMIRQSTKAILDRYRSRRTG